MISAHAPNMGSKIGIHKEGHKSCLTTSPAWVQRRKAKQSEVFTNSLMWIVHCLLPLSGRAGQAQGIQEDIKTFFSLIEISHTPAFDGWWHNLLSKASFSLLQWACGWKPFHESQSKITAHETLSFLKAPDHVQIMSLFHILEDSGCTAGSLKWCFKSLTCLSNICVALNVPSPEAI